jgi:replication factor A1
MDSGWRCEKCNKTYPECKRRFILSLTMNDHTGQDWFSAFDSVAQPMLGGHTADELNLWKQNGQEVSSCSSNDSTCLKLYYC